MAEPVTLRNLRDTFVTSAKPARNFAGRARLKIASGTHRGYVFWGKPMPLGSNITLGRFRMWNSEAFSGSVTLTVQAVAGNWAGSRINWNNQPGVTGPQASVTISGAAKDTLWEIDVESLLQTVADGGAWYGVRVTVTGTTIRNFYSTQAEESDFRPEVVIQWSEKPDPPENLVPNNNLSVSGSKPWLKYDIGEDDGSFDLAAHQIQLNTTNDFSGAVTFDSGWVNTTESSFNLATSAYAGLADGASIWWRVRVRDVSGIESEWATPVRFKRTTKGTLTPNVFGTQVITNLVTNPSFETNMTGWTGIGSVPTRDTTQFYTGSASANVTTNGSVANEGLQHSGTDIPITGGLAYSARVRFKAPAGRPVRIRFIETVGAGGFNDTNATATGDWQEVTLTRTTSAAATNMDIRTTWGGSTPIADTMYVDSIIVTQSATPVEYFDGDYGANHPEGVVAWTGTAHASTSTLTILYVDDSTPDIGWNLTGRTQSKYHVAIATIDEPDEFIYNTGPVSSTENSIDTGGKGRVIKSETDIYRLTMLVWDDIDRIKTQGDEIPYRYEANFIYKPGTAVSTPSSLTVGMETPFPWVRLTWVRSTPPDAFVVWRDGEIIDSGLDPADLVIPGTTTYEYRDRLAAPRVEHTWQVQANNNGEDSPKSSTVTFTTHPPYAWLMQKNGFYPVPLLKSSSEKAPVVDVTSQSLQEIHQPIGGGNPVLITQHVAGYEGHVEAVLADDAAPPLTAREMRDRIKRWKKNPGQELLLYMVDEVLQIVPYNWTYRPRSKGGHQVLYDVSFDFFQVNF